MFCFQIDDFSEKDTELSSRQHAIDKLLTGEAVIAIENRIIIVPIIGVSTGLLVLKSKESYDLNELDIPHIVNLTRIFNWYIK